MFDLSFIISSSSGGFNWYGFIIGTGMVICFLIASYLAKKRGYYSDLVFDIVIICIPLAIVGARAFYIIFDSYDPNSTTVWTFKKAIGLDGGLQGLAIYGGLIGACIGGFIVAALQKRRPEYERVTFIQMADLAFTTIILGQAIGRWGNFANQEAYGNIVTDPAWQWFPYAVHIDAAHSITNSAAWFQATFFYESFWNFIGFFILLFFYNGRRKSFDGFIVSLYCIYYGIGRFFIEGLRTDSLWLVPGVIRVSQFISVILVLFGIIYIAAHFYRARTAGKKPFVFVDIDKLDGSYFCYEKSMLFRRKRADEIKALAAAKAAAKESELETENEIETEEIPPNHVYDIGEVESGYDDLHEKIENTIIEKTDSDLNQNDKDNADKPKSGKKVDSEDDGSKSPGDDKDN